MVKLSTERFLPGLSRVKISKQYAEYKLSKQGFSISSLWRDVGEGDGRWPPSKEKPPSDTLKIAFGSFFFVSQTYAYSSSFYRTQIYWRVSEQDFLPERISTLKFNVTLVAKHVKQHISTPNGHISTNIGSIIGFWGMPLLLVTNLTTDHQYLWRYNVSSHF